MSITAVSSSPASQIKTPPVAASARSPDGDYKVKNAKSSQVKDSDGDFKPASTAATKSSPSVQGALSLLKAGG